MSVAVLGAGLSGLSAAFYLSKSPFKGRIQVLESASRVGGWIQSFRDENVCFEQAARTIRPHGLAGANTLKLLEELNMEESIVPVLRTNVAAQNRMIFAQGQLHVLPSSLKSLFKVQSPFTKPLIVFLLKEFGQAKRLCDDESIYDFANRRFGQEIADYLISPMICGICAGDAKEISVKFLMKTLWEHEQKHGSITKGLFHNFFNGNLEKPVASNLLERMRKENWAIYGLKNGLESLPKSLLHNLQKENVEMTLNCPIKAIDFRKKNQVVLETIEQTIEADKIISSIPARNLSKLLLKQHPQLSKMLNSIQSVTVVVINLEYSGKNIIKQPGFGFLVPPIEKRPILGVIYDSCCFEPQNNDSTILTVMMGGRWFDEYFVAEPQESFLKVALEQLKDILGIEDPPINHRINLLENCIPQYKVGHEKLVENIDSYITSNNLPLKLCGASYYGVGVNDVILSGKKAALSL